MLKKVTRSFCTNAMNDAPIAVARKYGSGKIISISARFLSGDGRRLREVSIFSRLDQELFRFVSGFAAR